MKSILKMIETPYVDSQTLINLLAGYSRPRERILRMVKNGELIRLKNGFYLIADKIMQGTNKVIPYEQVANFLYGPSYVSLEWALSFYGMIPERVYSITSMTLGRDKNFHTPVGDFIYYRTSQESYAIGVTRKDSSDFIGGFLIATPEKALIDLVYKTCKNLDKTQLKLELLESKRINQDVLSQLDKNLLIEIASTYKAKSVKNLIDVIGLI